MYINACDLMNKASVCGAVDLGFDPTRRRYQLRDFLTVRISLYFLIVRDTGNVLYLYFYKIEKQ